MAAPKYLQIADNLRKKIRSGELKPGDRLPTHETLLTEWRTTGMTVRQAIGKLTSEGLVFTRPTVGSFVRERRRYRVETGGAPGFAPVFPGLADRLLTESSGADRPLSQTVDVVLAEPPADVAEHLGSPGELAVLRHRVLAAGETPVVIADAYYPRHLVEESEIMQPALIEGGVIAALDELGLSPVRLRDEIYVRMPDPGETQLLDLDPGQPVAVEMCTGLTATGQAVFCSISVLPGDRHIVVSERFREMPVGRRAAG